ncbi:MAG TPA: MFS transporter [Actinocatenispora sp.]
MVAWWRRVAALLRAPADPTADLPELDAPCWQSGWCTWPRRRGFAQGIVHSASRLGNAVAPLLVAGLIAVSGWRASFWLVGLLSVAWAVLWYRMFTDSPRQHPDVTGAELAELGTHTLWVATVALALSFFFLELNDAVAGPDGHRPPVRRRGERHDEHRLRRRRGAVAAGVRVAGAGHEQLADPVPRLGGTARRRRARRRPAQPRPLGDGAVSGTAAAR